MIRSKRTEILLKALDRPIRRAELTGDNQREAFNLRNDELLSWRFVQRHGAHGDDTLHITDAGRDRLKKVLKTRSGVARGETEKAGEAA